jgi:hypothetical protein
MIQRVDKIVLRRLLGPFVGLIALWNDCVEAND